MHKTFDMRLGHLAFENLIELIQTIYFKRWNNNKNKVTNRKYNDFNKSDL